MSSQPQITFVESTDSTNLALRQELVKNQQSDGVLWAKHQSAGRGRLGRTWLSPEGGLYFSIAHPVGDSAPPAFVFAAGVAVHKVFSQLTDAISLKWPNDLLAHPAGQPDDHKLGGILAEYHTEGVVAPLVIVGVGINVNTSVTIPPDAPHKGLPPIGLAELTHQEHQLEDIVSALVPACMESFRALCDPRVDPSLRMQTLTQSWMKASSTIGRKVKVTLSDRTLTGEAVGLSEGLGLLVREESGEVHEIQAGDCIHLRDE